MVTLGIPPGLTIKIFMTVPQTASMFSIRISEQTATISVYRINRLLIYNPVIVCPEFLSDQFYL